MGDTLTWRKEKQTQLLLIVVDERWALISWSQTLIQPTFGEFSEKRRIIWPGDGVAKTKVIYQVISVKAKTAELEKDQFQTL